VGYLGGGGRTLDRYGALEQLRLRVPSPGEASLGMRGLVEGYLTTWLRLPKLR